LDWFEKSAPIRIKFRAMMIAQAILATIGTAVIAFEGVSQTALIVCMAVFGATILVIQLASVRICTPYVNTVLRMEALATGDVDSPFSYTDYTDCVGRMTKAMSTFRDNAVEVQTSRESQDRIVESLGEGLQKLAANELDYRIHEPFTGRYEALRQAFNKSLEALGNTITAVNGAATSVSTGAAEIRSASDDLAIRNEQQAASLEETAAAMNQVTSLVNETAKGATDVQRSIGEANNEAIEGGAVVQRAVAAMAAIEKSSEEISQIINVIDGIAFQTNLLALNAGVEAARAGDAGKGFAVVANEVRALAQRSADAAKDIKELITASTQQVVGGVKLVGETGEVLERIVGRVGEISGLVTDIAKSTETQAASLQQVNAAVSEMDRMTQHNAAMVEQSTAAARSLADEAGELTNMVSRFRTDQEQGAFAVNAKLHAPRRRAVPPPAVQGNLALKAGSSGHDDDWTEF
jgi:methyl-accepting chemotaxis protein